MRKYFTWRCIGLHVLLVVLVPTFLVAGWWQYHVALSGNDLSWLYTVEWPFFSVYAVYVWWRMIHDETTLFDRLWAIKQRAAADATGKPLHEIPGWAMDKELSKEVVQASLDAARLLQLARVERGALEPPGLGSVPGGESRARHGLPSVQPALGARAEPADAEEDRDAEVIDARVLEVKAVVDEELDAYNRYLAELAWRDPPKRWRASRDRRRRAAPVPGMARESGPLLPAQLPRGRPPSPPEDGRSLADE